MHLDHVYLIKINLIIHEIFSIIEKFQFNILNFIKKNFIDNQLNINILLQISRSKSRTSIYLYQQCF